MRNIALRLSYDGSNYHGWQAQRTEVTVQETLETAVSAVCGEKVHIIGCGRTDAGVHALRYCANFRTGSRIPIDRVALAVNTHLPPDIAVGDACEVDWEFNAVTSCIQKEYVYRIHNSRLRNPFWQNRACFYPAPLRLETMQRAAAAFVGTHDFAAVRSVGTETVTTVRTVRWCEVEQERDVFTVRVCADGFLYNMVRAIVGTIVFASHGKLDPDSIPELLEKGDRRLTGPTMPAAGLYMNRLWYDGPAGEMMERAALEKIRIL